MKKIRALFAALLIAATSFFVVVNDVTPASAWTATCQFYPGSSSWAPHLGGSYCYTNRIGGAFHYTVITCKYTLYGFNHTYNVYGPYASDGTWSWAYCGNHHKDNNTDPDWVIHLYAYFYPNDQYQGGGSSGSW